MKIVRRSLLILAAMFLLLIFLMPLVLKGKVYPFIQKKIDEQVHATVQFDPVKVSLLKSFPDLRVDLPNLCVVGLDSFALDTLVQAKNIGLTLDLFSVLGEDGIRLKGILLDAPRMHAKVLADGTPNWDIMKAETVESEADSESSEMRIQLTSLRIRDGSLRYEDAASNIDVRVRDWSGKLTGDFSASTSDVLLETLLGQLSVAMDGMSLLQDARLEADMNLSANLDDMSFVFKDNRFILNEMHLALDGGFSMPDTSHMLFDLNLLTQDITFKQLLSLVPVLYQKEFADLQADGVVQLTATVKGTMTDRLYPAFDLRLNVENGSFRYPSLPASVDQIGIAAHVFSPGGDLDATQVNVSRFHLEMAGQPMDLTLQLKTPISDPDLSAAAQGRMNLSKVKDVYPLEEGMRLSGTTDMDVSVAGKMSYLENEQYDLFEATGRFSAEQFQIQVPDMPDVWINHAAMRLSPQSVWLDALDVKIGDNDLNATGNLQNVLPWLLKDQTLRGVLTVQSDYLNLNDFMSDSTVVEESDTAQLQAIKIPRNLDLTLNARGGEVWFDQLQMKQAVANMRIKDGKMQIEDLSAKALGGRMGLTGSYEWPEGAQPDMKMHVDLTNVQFSEVFKTFVSIRTLVPIFEQTQGAFSMKGDFASLFDAQFNPDLSSLLGAGSLNASNVQISGVKAFEVLAEVFKNEALNVLSLKDIRLPFHIENGRLNTPGIKLPLGKSSLLLSGSAGLDQQLSYDLTFQLPDGNNAFGLSQLKGQLLGSFRKPEVKLDTKAMAQSAVSSLIEKSVGIDVDSVKVKAQAEMELQAKKLREQARLAGEALIEQAEKEGQTLVDKATNPLLKAAAQKTADLLVQEARKKAAELQEAAENKIKEQL